MCRRGGQFMASPGLFALRAGAGAFESLCGADKQKQHGMNMLLVAKSRD